MDKDYKDIAYAIGVIIMVLLIGWNFAWIMSLFIQNEFLLVIIKIISRIACIVYSIQLILALVGGSICYIGEKIKEFFDNFGR